MSKETRWFAWLKNQTLFVFPTSFGCDFLVPLAENSCHERLIPPRTHNISYFDIFHLLKVSNAARNMFFSRWGEDS